MMSDNQVETDKIEWMDWPGILLFMAIILVVFLQFCTRYFLNNSLAWTEEVSRYLLVLMVYAGAVPTLIRGENICLEIVYRYAPMVNAKPMAIISELICLAYYSVFAFGVFLLSLNVTQSLISVRIPKSYCYAFVFICAVLLIIGSARRSLYFFRRSSQDIHDEFGGGVL